MRMWLVDPKIMCRQHLLGEHLELHMFANAINNNKNIDGFIKNNLVEPRSIFKRHKELMEEMLRRRYKHNSGLQVNPVNLEKYKHIKIDKDEALKDLLKRCKKCRIIKK